MLDPFPYDLTPAGKNELLRWENVQLDKEAKQRKKDNFKINEANIFRTKNNKIKLKVADPFSDHARLYKVWISEQQKRGRVFKKKPRTPLLTERWSSQLRPSPSVFYKGRYMNFA
jgi:hypothetical protein